MTNVEKLWEKIKLNSFYAPYSNNYFVLFDKDKATELTKESKKNLKDLNDRLGNVL